MIRIIVQTSTAQLCCYPRNSWAVFVFKPTKPDEPDWKCVKNGRLTEVLEKWNEIAFGRN